MTCDLPLKPLIAGFLSMANRQDRHHRAIETITDGVAALTEGDKPIPEFSWHVTGWTANFRVCGERLDALADGAHRAPGRLAIFRGEKRMEARHIFRSRRRPDQTRHGSLMGCGRRNVFAGL